MILLRLEAAVVNADWPVYLRAHSWLKLVSFWTALRGEDSILMIPSSTAIDLEADFTAELRQTRTTGPGKRIKIRTIHVSHTAYIHDRTWLKIGRDLWGWC